MKLLEIENSTSHLNEMIVNVNNIVYIQSAVTRPGSIIRLTDGTSLYDYRTVSELKVKIRNL